MQLARKNVQNITPYVGGRPIEEIKRQFRLKEVIKLASNENPLGGSPKAVRAMQKALKSVNRYPDGQGFYLKKGLAEFLKVEPENLVLGNGSDELIDIIIKTFVEDDENIVTSEVTFLEYEIISKVNNKKVITVPLKSFKYDLAGLKNAISDKTKLVFIANPNNPTGTYLTKGQIQDFLKGLPEHVIVVLDEAYDTFIDVDDYPSGLDYFKDANVITLKTFSKGYGLAGLRIGYAIARKEFTSFMERVRQPFNTNLIAQEAALAALGDKAFLKKARRINAEGKKYFSSALKQLGIFYVDSVTNFILMDVQEDGVGLFKKMLEKGVIVRDMKQYNLNNFIRVTIGTEKENKRFISVLKEIKFDKRRAK